MATERNTSSVLAKLMGIDRISRPHTSHGRGRVFSENYLRNVASVVDREKSLLDADVNGFTMDVDDHVECEYTVEISEGLSENSSSGLVVDSSMKSECKEVSFSTKTLRFMKGEVLDHRGRNRLYSPLGHLAGQSSSCDPEAEKCKLIEPHLQQQRSCHNINNGFSSCTTDKKQKTVFGVRKKGLGLQERKVNSLLNNGMKSTVRGNLSPKEIAKQITNQVNHSVWHSCINGAMSARRPENGVEKEYKGTLPSAACSVDIQKNSEAFSSNPTKRSDSRKATRTEEIQLDSWNTSNLSLEVRTTGERITEDQVHVVGNHRRNYGVDGEDVNSCTPVSGEVYRTPRSKERSFTVVPNGSLRTGESNNNVYNESLEGYAGDAYVSSTFEPCDPTLNLCKLHLQDIKPSITNGSGKLEEVNTFEDTFSARESFSDQSAFSDVESSTYHEASEVLNMTGGNSLEKDFSQHISLESLYSTCFPAPPSVEIEEVTPNDKMDTSSEFQGKQLSIQSSKRVLLHKLAQNLEGFVLRHELKRTNSPPGSPVSSLEGPEACRLCLNFTVKSKEYFPIPQCLNDGVLGLQAKLHLMEAFSIDSGSEGPGMLVSSDDWDGTGSLSCYREDAQITECTSESYDFSYLVDVLAESGILMGHLEIVRGTWCSDGYMLDPSVFDSLEEKYGTSTARERSERLLLFDRINSGLAEILQPSAGIHSWRKPVAKRLSTRRSQESIEEELWALLVSQEEQFKSDSDKLYGTQVDWLDLEGDVDCIIQDIQSVLVDELVEESVSVVML